MTSQHIQKTLEEFDEKFPLEFFATQDWKYDYQNPPSQFEFSRWQREATVIAKGRQIMMSAFLSQALTEQHEKDVQSFREKVKEHFENFTLYDWSGEYEILHQVEKLGDDLLASLDETENI